MIFDLELNLLQLFAQLRTDRFVFGDDVQFCRLEIKGDDFIKKVQEKSDTTVTVEKGLKKTEFISRQTFKSTLMYRKKSLHYPGP